MKRRSLRRKFVGEPDPEMEGLALAVQNARSEEVELEVKGGKVVIIIPEGPTDQDIFSECWFDRFAHWELELEQGRVLAAWVCEGATGVDVRLTPPGKKA